MNNLVPVLSDENFQKTIKSFKKSKTLVKI